MHASRAAAERRGDFLGVGEVVHVAQRERQALLGGELGERSRENVAAR